MTSCRLLQILTASVASSCLWATAANAMPELPSCANKQKVSLVINTDTTSGWKVNGVPAVIVSDGAWVNAAPAKWIGLPMVSPPATLTYSITFATPYMHGPMSVQAKWAADNCGQSLKAGSGPVAPASACPGGKDFLAMHVTNAQFAQVDSNAATATLTFTISNVKWSPAGMAGTFTITAICVLS